MKKAFEKGNYMKAVKQLFKFFALLLLVSSCSRGPSAIPAKYNLDDQLEEVRCVHKCDSMDWDRVDNQSFILQTSQNKYYLVVLDRKSTSSSLVINNNYTNDNSIIWPGFENITMNNKGHEETYLITKIYRFKDPQQVDEIRIQLLLAA